MLEFNNTYSESETTCSLLDLAWFLLSCTKTLVHKRYLGCLNEGKTGIPLNTFQGVAWMNITITQAPSLPGMDIRI